METLIYTGLDQNKNIHGKPYLYRNIQVSMEKPYLYRNITVLIG